MNELLAMLAAAGITTAIILLQQAVENRRKAKEPPAVIPAPQWLKDQMEKVRQMQPPTPEEVATQMKFSAAYSQCLDAGMSADEAKEFVQERADDIAAGMKYPWRKKIGENRYEGSCGCVFNGEGERVEWCGDHY